MAIQLSHEERTNLSLELSHQSLETLTDTYFKRNTKNFFRRQMSFKASTDRFADATINFRANDDVSEEMMQFSLSSSDISRIA